MGDPQNDSKWDWHQCGSNRKKTSCFSSQIFTFFLGKNAGSSTGKFRMKKWKKTRSKKNAFFAPEVFGDSWTSNIIVGCSFDINIDAPKVWGMSGHYTPAGRFFKKCQKFCQKIGPETYFTRQNVAPCGSNKFFFIGNKFYIHKLHSATRVSRRNSFRPK